MKLVWTIALLVLLTVWECESQCVAQLAEYVKGFEASRNRVCQAGQGLVISGQTLEPVMETIAKILENQPTQLKGAIPDAIGKVFPQIRDVVTKSNVDLCNNKEALSILHVVEQTLDRDLATFDRALEPYCEDYFKFLESKVGQDIVRDVNKLLRDVEVVSVEEIA